jgi:uncharacterized protein with NAD-binding domain and iron-sulfur cluster
MRMSCLVELIDRSDEAGGLAVTRPLREAPWTAVALHRFFDAYTIQRANFNCHVKTI